MNTVKKIKDSHAGGLERRKRLLKKDRRHNDMDCCFILPLYYERKHYPS